MRKPQCYTTPIALRHVSLPLLEAPLTRKHPCPMNPHFPLTTLAPAPRMQPPSVTTPFPHGPLAP